MWKWRNIALEFFPELSDDISDVENSYQLWIELEGRFITVCDNKNTLLVDKIFDFAKYFEQEVINSNEALRDDDYTGLMYCFYEDISGNDFAMEAMKKKFSREEICEHYYYLIYHGENLKILSILLNGGPNDSLYLSIFERNKNEVLQKMKSYTSGVDEGVMFHLQKSFPEIIDDVLAIYPNLAHSPGK